MCLFSWRWRCLVTMQLWLTDHLIQTVIYLWVRGRWYKTFFFSLSAPFSSCKLSCICCVNVWGFFWSLCLHGREHVNTMHEWMSICHILISRYQPDKHKPSSTLTADVSVCLLLSVCLAMRSLWQRGSANVFMWFCYKNLQLRRVKKKKKLHSTVYKQTTTKHSLLLGIVLKIKFSLTFMYKTQLSYNVFIQVTSKLNLLQQNISQKCCIIAHIHLLRRP